MPVCATVNRSNDGLEKPDNIDKKDDEHKLAIACLDHIPAE